MLKMRQNSSTVIRAAELPFDDDSKAEDHIESLKCRTDDGTAFEIIGKIDYA